MKIKLTIYNTILMSIMVSLVLIFMVSISENVVQIGSENILKEVVYENIEEIKFKQNQLDLSEIEYFEDGVTTLIYSQDGFLLAGHFKTEFTEPLLDGVFTNVSYLGVDYLIYDKYVQINSETSYFARGILSITSELQMVNTILLIAFLSLPIFIIISAFGSYLICKKSLKPLDKMIETTEKIIYDDDLSVRINHTEGKDEISRLAKSFDDMLIKLEDMFEKEKRLTSDVSHELRTPVSVILAQCEVSEENETTTVIKNQALKIRLIITQLLKLVRLENGIEKAEFQELDLSELVEMVCEEQRELTDICIETNIENQISAKLDYSMIMRILTNLINNSSKYIGNGDKIEVNLALKGENIHLTVADNGIGISEENQEKVFDRFFMVDKSRTNDESMGLGLSMVKQLVEINHGTITIDSEIDKGTTFTIIFKGELL
ncbi:MAG: HAMP domain-containing sensor histidine kinase [Clostridia bacterium]